MNTKQVNCLFCKKIFDADCKELKRGNAKFCSRSCARKYSHLVNPKPKPKPNFPCSNISCKNLIYRNATQIKQCKSGLFFCCRMCKDESQKIGGLQAIQPNHYKNGSTTYRQLAMSKLPNVCCKCGYNKYPEILQVHHKDGNRKNNDISNLSILCPTCHSVEHFLTNTGPFSIHKSSSPQS